VDRSIQKTGSPRKNRCGCGEFSLTGGSEFAGGERFTAGRNGITTGRRKTILDEEKSSAGQDEMTVTREQAVARQTMALSGRQAGNPHASIGRPGRIPLLFS
jgi:hypothetical protein